MMRYRVRPTTLVQGQQTRGVLKVYAESTYRSCGAVCIAHSVLGVSVIVLGRGRGLGWEGGCVCVGLEGEGGMSGYTLYMMSITEYLFLCHFQ